MSQFSHVVNKRNEYLNMHFSDALCKMKSPGKYCFEGLNNLSASSQAIALAYRHHHQSC